MADLKNELMKADAMKEMAQKVGKGLAEAVEKHPDKALGIAGVLGGLYILKNKKITFKMKKGDSEVEFKSE